MPSRVLVHLLHFLHRVHPALEGQGVSDGALLEQFVTRRDETAFELLMQGHGPMVLGVCRRVTGDPHAAEDAFQATFLVLARRAASIRQTASVGSWLHGVAQRIAVRARTQATARRQRERQVADMREPEPLDELTWHELRAALDEEIARLPEKYRAVVVLRHLEGKSCEQAAQELKCPVSTLATRQRRALELLRKQLVRRGIVLSATALPAALTEQARAAPLAASLTLKLMQAAASVAAGKPLAAGILSTQAIALAEQAMKTMIGITGKLIVLLAVLGLAVGSGLAGHSAWVAQGPPQPDEKRPPAAKGDALKKEAPPAVALDRLGEALPDGALARLAPPGLRHVGARQVIFSTDGKTVFTTGEDRVVRRWEVSSGKLFGTQSYATDKREYADLTELAFDSRFLPAISSSYFSPDGKTVAVLGLKHLYFFDAATGKELHRVAQDFSILGNALDIAREPLIHGSRGGAAFTANGKQFGVLRASNAFLLFDVSTGKAINTGLPEKLEKPELQIANHVQAALDPNGKQLATFSRGSPGGDGDHPKDGVTLWDLTCGKVLHTINVPDGPGHQGMTYSPTGNRLLLTSAKEAALYNTATGEKAAAFPFPEGFSAFSFSFSPDGSLLAGLAGLRTPGVTVSPLDTSYTSQTILLLEAKTMKEIRKLPNTNYCSTIQFSPDGKTLAGLGTNVIRLWNVADAKPLHQFDDQDDVFWVVYSPDGKSLASGGGDVTVIWDVETKKPRASIPSPMYRKAPIYRKAPGISWEGAGLPGSTFSADGKTLFGPVDFGTIKGWNVADGKETATTFLTADDEHGRQKQIIRSLTVSRDGKQLMALCTLQPPNGFEERSLVVWDIASGKRGDRTTFSSQSNNILALSPNGSYLLYPQKGINHALYDFPQKQERIIRSQPMGPRGFAGRVRGAFAGCFSHDSALLAIPDGRQGENTVSVYETATGKLRITFRQPVVDERAPPAFTPDDRYLLFAGPDAWHLWEIATGKEAMRCPKQGRGTVIVPAPDGRSAAMVAPDSTILLWDLLPSSRVKGELTAKDLESLWTDLASEDAAKAYRAGGRLIGAPATAWAFLDKQVRPVAADTERIRRLIADLDSNDFEKRQAASKDLQQLELLAEPELRKTLDSKLSAETSKAIKALLDDDMWTVKTAEERRRTRAVWVLEQIGTADARKPLERLAGGAAAARQTREAKAALQRLKAKE